MNFSRFFRVLRRISCMNSGLVYPARLQYRRVSDITEHPNKTTIDFLNDTANRDVTRMPPYVTKYTPGGFVINGMHIYGPVGILSRHVICWKIPSIEAMAPEGLSAFTVLEPPIDIIVIGTGDKLLRLNPEVLQYMKRHGILVEVQDTPHACATFNFLLEERRSVAAALVPVEEIDEFEDD